jgi:hypothetical protein
MIGRLLVFGFFYAAMFLGWIGVGLYMLLAPASFVNFVRDNIALWGHGGPRSAGKFVVRLIGAGLVAFAVRFAFRTAELFR